MHQAATTIIGVSNPPPAAVNVPMLGCKNLLDKGVVFAAETQTGRQQMFAPLVRWLFAPSLK